MLSPLRFPTTWPTPDNLRSKRARMQVDTFIYGLIDQRRKTQDQRDDLLGMLLSAEDEETGERMSDQQLRDECVTHFSRPGTKPQRFRWPGQFICSPNTPTYWPGSEAESQSVLGDARTPAPEAFRALTYTMQVVQESLRLYPPAWIMSRRAHNDDHIGPYTIPAGDTALVCPYLLHRDPANWPLPDRFDPDRFAPGGPKEQLAFVCLSALWRRPAFVYRESVCPDGNADFTGPVRASV